MWNNPRYAEEYDRRLAQEGYPGEQLGIVMEELKGARTVIDCGAGSGFYSVPLARAGFDVTAVEPSPVMSSLFNNKILPGEKLPLRIINKRWLDWEGPRADVLIAVHSMQAMGSPAESAAKMHSSASKTVILTVNEDLKPDTVVEKIRGALSFPVKYKEPLNLEKCIKALGIPYVRRDLDQERISHFTDIDREAEYYTFHLGLDVSQKKTVRRVIENELTEDAEGYGLKFIYHDTMFTFN